MRFSVLIALLLLIVPSSLLCQEEDPPMKWGKIPREQLEMKSFPADTNATAVILCDYGDVNFDENDNIVYTRHMRVKILTKAGFVWGSCEVPYKKEGGVQHVDDIEGATYMLGQDGAVNETELESESVFDEVLAEGWRRKKFTLPMLSPGCVIEYRYTVISTNPYYMPDWFFQSDEPTLWSEYRVKASQTYTYSSVTHSLLPFAVEETTRLRKVVPTPSGAKIGLVDYTHYIMKDVPALREEPFMTTLDDFRSRVYFQLSSVNYPDQPSRKILNTWDKVAEDFNGLEIFGRQMEGSDRIAQRTEQVLQGLSDPVKKMGAVYDFVRSTMVWDGRERIFCTRDLDEVLESKKGTSAEISMLLISMLRKAGIQAYPVLLSTRDHGEIQKLFPIIEQFNYLIACAQSNGSRYFLDATDRYHPFAFLPVRALNHTGFLIDGKNYEWVRIESVVATLSETVVDLALHPDGSVAGKIRREFSGQNGVLERGNFAEKKPDEYVKVLLKAEAFGLTLDSIRTANADDVKLPFIVEANISSALCVQVMGDRMTMTPMLMERSTENPFKLEKRIFPVDFAYPRTVRYTLHLTLPEGFSVGDVPKDLTLYLPNLGGSYTRITTVSGASISMSAVMIVEKTVFEPLLYPALRSVYDRIVAAEAEQILIQKKSPESPNVQKKK